MNKTVDIIIPVYNTSADLLEHCFLSAINQTWKNIKIIVKKQWIRENPDCVYSANTGTKIITEPTEDTG